jgi:hypothetical protein
MHATALRETILVDLVPDWYLNTSENNQKNTTCIIFSEKNNDTKMLLFIKINCKHASKVPSTLSVLSTRIVKPAG